MKNRLFIISFLSSIIFSANAELIPSISAGLIAPFIQNASTQENLGYNMGVNMDFTTPNSEANIITQALLIQWGPYTNSAPLEQLNVSPTVGIIGGFRGNFSQVWSLVWGAGPAYEHVSAAQAGISSKSQIVGILEVLLESKITSNLAINFGYVGTLFNGGYSVENTKINGTPRLSAIELNLAYRI